MVERIEPNNKCKRVLVNFNCQLWKEYRSWCILNDVQVSDKLNQLVSDFLSCAPEKRGDKYGI